MNFVLYLVHITDKTVIFVFSTFQPSYLMTFRARSHACFKNDFTIITNFNIDVVKSNYGLRQIINGPIPILNDTLFCIRLIFTCKEN